MCDLTPEQHRRAIRAATSRMTPGQRRIAVMLAKAGLMAQEKPVEDVIQAIRDHRATAKREQWAAMEPAARKERARMMWEKKEDGNGEDITGEV